MLRATRASPKIDGPVMVALHIITGRLRERGFWTDHAVTVDVMFRWLQVYQYAIEREVVTRLTSVAPGDDATGTLVEILDREIDGLLEKGLLRQSQ